MRNFMMRHVISIILIFISLFLFSVLSKSTPGISQEIEKHQKSSCTHPLTLSPEETLKVILQAYINRDVETVMDYYPGGDTEKWKIWLNRAREGVESYMTNQKHIKQIVEVKLKSVKDDDGDKIGFIAAKIETTPGFSGAVNREVDGRFIASYHWVLRQYKGKGPWDHDGGGF